jgi:ABC-type Fe3+-siderophore transport system permease subunit
MKTDLLQTLRDVDPLLLKNFPSSQKVYKNGSRDDIKVPFRKITLEDTRKSDGTFEKNPPLYVYDTMGVYTDPKVKIDLTRGIKPVRESWINERDDIEESDDFSSLYFHERYSNENLKWILVNIRIPRATTAVLSGISLPLSGLLLQTVFSNPLAGPYILGISSGASFGVALLLLGTGLLGITALAGSLSIIIASFAGAMLVLLIIFVHYILFGQFPN